MEDVSGEPEEIASFLKTWFQGNRDARLKREISNACWWRFRPEKKRSTRRTNDTAGGRKKSAPKVHRTVFSPADTGQRRISIQALRSLRSRSIATGLSPGTGSFGDKTAPLKFDRELTAELLDQDSVPNTNRLKDEV